MRLRGLFVTALSASSAAGVVRVLDGRPGPTMAAGAGAIGAALLYRIASAVRRRWRRVRSWRRPGEVALLTPGPRRVLLAQTPLAGTLGMSAEPSEVVL